MEPLWPFWCAIYDIISSPLDITEIFFYFFRNPVRTSMLSLPPQLDISQYMGGVQNFKAHSPVMLMCSKFELQAYTKQHRSNFDCV
jgi:hypothetical protein